MSGEAKRRKDAIMTGPWILGPEYDGQWIVRSGCGDTVCVLDCRKEVAELIVNEHNQKVVRRD